MFIATLFGLALAMITLIGEVLYYRKRTDTKDKGKDKKKPKSMDNEKILLQKMAAKLQLKPAPTNAFFEKQNNPPRVSHISVYPRNFPFKE